MTPSETIVAWLSGAGRWLWANRSEVAGIVSTGLGIGWYLKWNDAVRPPPTDPVAFDRWRRRERFAFAVWHKSGLVPKWLRDAAPWPNPDTLPAIEPPPPGAPKGPPPGTL